MILQITMAAGLGIIFYAGLSSGDVWKEFYQYFRESRFVSFSFNVYVHMMQHSLSCYYRFSNCIDLVLLVFGVMIRL